MKKKSISRGLYRSVTHTSETEEEVWQACEYVASDLDRYLDESQAVARNILRQAGYDPDTLFDIVSNETGRYVQHSQIDRDSLSPDVYYALKIMERCRYAKSDLEDNHRRDALFRGIQLAEAVEHFNANRAWLKPVKAGVGTIKGGRKGARETHGKLGDKTRLYESKYLERRKLHPDETRTQARKAIAMHFGLSLKHGYKTIERATKGH